jgi:hypothetical protein
MLSAHVLIQTEVGKVDHVAPGAQRPGWCAVGRGPRRPLRRHRQVQAPGLDQLGRLVVAHIQAVDRVSRTLTCTVLHR